MIEVVAWGIAGSVRDAGRPGLAHLGRSRGGAVDLAALALGNRIVGNPADAAGFESSGGLVLAPRRPVLLAVTGSPCDLRVIDGPPLGWGVPVVLPAGSRVRVGRLHGGARTYVAVRGGVVGAPKGAGAAGQAVGVGPDPGSPVAVHPVASAPRRDVARVWPGPRRDWFTSAAWELLTSAVWTVSPDSDRAGARLAGPALPRAVVSELASEGLVEGALQVPPDGRPIVMLADHPVTGGYPVIGVVDPDDVAVIAQTPVGAGVRFTAAPSTGTRWAHRDRARWPR